MNQQIGPKAGYININAGNAKTSFTGNLPALSEAGKNSNRFFINVFKSRSWFNDIIPNLT